MSRELAYLGRGNRRNNQIQGTNIFLLPTLIIVSGNISVGSEFQGILSLVGAPGNGDHLVGTERPGEHNCEVAQSTDPNDANFLAGASAIFAQGRINSDATAQHWGRVCWRETIGDLEDEMCWRTVVQGVSAIGLAAVHVHGVVRGDYVRALGLAVGLAFPAGALAAPAGISLSSHTDKVADFDILNLGANPHGSSHDFVANANRVVGWALNAAYER